MSADAVRRSRAERAAQRVEISGRMVAVGVSNHGSRSTYINWSCRCDPCTKANSVAVREYRKSLTGAK